MKLFPHLSALLITTLLVAIACQPDNTEQKKSLLSAAEVAGSRPNIIYIMTDDHAIQALSAYGSKINQTPNLDRIANEGMRFANSFVTNSICAPSRAVLLTGKYSHHNGVLDNGLRFDSTQTTFPMLLQDAGYQTAMIGKWHLKSPPIGFDYWNVLPGQGNYYNPDFIEMGKRERKEGYVSDLVTDFALDWLGKRDTAKPFCMLYHHKAPHRRWLPGPDHLNTYDDVEIPMPETYFEDYSKYGKARQEQEMQVDGHMNFYGDLKIKPEETDPAKIKDWSVRSYWNEYNRMNPEQKAAWDAAYEEENQAFLAANLEGEELAKWKYQRYIKDYLRCIASVDDNVGRLLDYLDETGLAENTIVVYTSDQGFYLGEHGWFDKRFMYEESLRMPLLVKYPPMIEPGTVNDNLALNLDFAPTFLDLAGIEKPDFMQGESLLPLMKTSHTDDWRDAMYYHYYEYPAVHMVKRHYGIRDSRYKLIHFYYDIDEWELYDLETDPKETQNLIEDPAQQDRIEDMKERLYAMQAQYGDTTTQPVERYQIFSNTDPKR